MLISIVSTAYIRWGWVPLFYGLYANEVLWLGCCDTSSANGILLPSQLIALSTLDTLLKRSIAELLRIIVSDELGWGDRALLPAMGATVVRLLEKLTEFQVAGYCSSLMHHLLRRRLQFKKMFLPFHCRYDIIFQTNFKILRYLNCLLKHIFLLFCFEYIMCLVYFFTMNIIYDPWE